MTKRSPTRIVVDNTPLARAVGERIRTLRLQRGLLQKDLAAGRFTPAFISALERGHAKPSLASMAHIAKRLGVWIGELLPPQETPTDAPTEED